MGAFDYHVALYEQVNKKGSFIWSNGRDSLPLKKDAPLQFAEGQLIRGQTNISQNCGAINLDNDVEALYVVSCDIDKNYICEVCNNRHYNI